MTLYPVAGQSAGFPVSTDSYGARQDTSSLAQEILDQVPDAPTPPWSSGDLSVVADGSVVIDGAYRICSDIFRGPGPSSSAAKIQTANALQNVWFNVWYNPGWPGYQMEFWSDGIGLVGAINGSKSFVIDHPLDPDRYLVHACLEGPEAAVFYRGKVELEDGKAEVVLPDYFEVLTVEGTATVQVSAVLDDEDAPLFCVGATEVKDGRFVVRGAPSGTVAWRVEATRADVPAVIVEPLKSDVSVHGSGPYRWVE